RRRGGWDSGPAERSSEGAGSSSRVIRASAPAWEMASSLTPPAAWRSLSVLGWSSTLPSSPGAVVNFPPRSTPGCTRWGSPRYPSDRAFSEGSGQHDEVVAVDDLVGVPVGEVAGAATGDGPQLGGAEAHEPLGEDPAVGSGDLDGRVDVEATLDRGDPGGQERHVALEQGAAGAVVDDDRALRAHREGDPEATGGQALGL